MRGAETVIRELIRQASPPSYDSYFADTNTQQIEQWFNLGGTVELNDKQPSAKASLAELQEIQGLFEKLSPLGINSKSETETAVSAAEFLLEGMTAHKRISRSEERTFTAGDKEAAQRRRRPVRRKNARARKDREDDAHATAPAAASTSTAHTRVLHPATLATCSRCC